MLPVNGSKNPTIRWIQSREWLRTLLIHMRILLLTWLVYCLQVASIWLERRWIIFARVQVWRKASSLRGYTSDCKHRWTSSVIGGNKQSWALVLYEEYNHNPSLILVMPAYNLSHYRLLHGQFSRVKFIRTDAFFMYKQNVCYVSGRRASVSNRPFTIRLWWSNEA